MRRVSPWQTGGVETDVVMSVRRSTVMPEKVALSKGDMSTTERSGPEVDQGAQSTPQQVVPRVETIVSPGQ
jgi:hypothetical protein